MCFGFAPISPNDVEKCEKLENLILSRTDVLFREGTKLLLEDLIATREKALIEGIIKMADKLESECAKDGDKGTHQWRAFKEFRNTLRNKFLTPLSDTNREV